MKIEEEVYSLNQESPDWKTVNRFLVSPKLQYSLLNFLDNFASIGWRTGEDEKVAVHGLRILGRLQDERVLPYLVEFLGHPRLTPGPQENLTREYYGYSESIILSCKQTLELLAVKKSFLNTFWTLYKVSYDREVAREYLNAAILCNLRNCGPNIADRINFKVQSKIQKALLRDFSYDPFYVAYQALLTLNTQFLPLLEEVIKEQLEEFEQNFHEPQTEDYMVFWGQIPLAWFILNEVQNQSYHDIQDHIRMLIFDDPWAEFDAFYKRSGVKYPDHYQMDPQKEEHFRQRLKQEVSQYFQSLHIISPPPPPKKRTTLAGTTTFPDNVLPLFK